jgi:hypothetical protein
MFDRTFEYQARWVKHPHHVGVRRIKKNLRYLANTFNLHNVVISGKYSRLARVLAARYQQSRRYGMNGIYFSFAKGARLSYFFL